MFRSATFRLTLYYLAIIAVISIGFSAALYQVASHDLAIGLDRQNRRITKDFPIFSGSPYLRINNDIRDSQHDLLARLIAGNIIVVVVAGFASYALARRTLEPIKAAHERQKRFTADVSHELRTPLAALKMESEVALLDDKATTTSLRTTLTSNIEEAQKLTDLVSNLLRLSQLDDVEKAAFTTPVAVQDPLQSAINRLQPVADSRNIQFDTALGKQKTRTYADTAMLEQLFVILLDNAVKYSPVKSTVHLTVKRQQGTVHVSIRDEGPGIAKQDLEHVFDRFYRADSSRTSGQTSGFGLGLSIAKRIADMHNAVIQLTSQPGKGTTATVILPIADAV